MRGDKTIKVQIPAGVATGQYMTLRAVGNAGARNGERGDVHVVFEVQNDPRFERDGEELYTEVLVTYPQLVLGAMVDVPTVTSTVALTVPAGCATGVDAAPLQASDAPPPRAAVNRDATKVRARVIAFDLLTGQAGRAARPRPEFAAPRAVRESPAPG